MADGYPLGASGLSELVEAEAQDKVVSDLREQVKWVRANEPEEKLVFNRAAGILTEDYRAEVLIEV